VVLDNHLNPHHVPPHVLDLPIEVLSSFDVCVSSVFRVKSFMLKQSYMVKNIIIYSWYSLVILLYIIELVRHCHL
jgi:hypothetical protein